MVKKTIPHTANPIKMGKSKPCNIPIPISVYTRPEDYLQRNQETAPKIRQTYKIFFNVFICYRLLRNSLSSKVICPQFYAS